MSTAVLIVGLRNAVTTSTLVNKVSQIVQDSQPTTVLPKPTPQLKRRPSPDVRLQQTESPGNLGNTYGLNAADTLGPVNPRLELPLIYPFCEVTP